MARRLQRAGLTADMVTALGFVLNIGAAVAIVVDYTHLGIVLIALGLIVNALDGPIVIAEGRFLPSPREALFGSVFDCLSDSALIIAIAWQANISDAKFSLILPMGVLALVSIAAYTRARADVLGLDPGVGPMERTQRTLVLAFGLLVPSLLELSLWIVLTLSFVTSSQRFLNLWRQASEAQPAPYEQRSARRRRLHQERRSSRDKRSDARRTKGIDTRGSW